MNNGGVGLKPEEQQQQRGDRPPPQYLDEVLHPTAPHPRFAKNVYIELAAFSDSIYERGRMSRVQIAIDSIQSHRQWQFLGIKLYLLLRSNNGLVLVG